MMQLFLRKKAGQMRCRFLMRKKERPMGKVTDTIAGIATASAIGGISMIRLSGEEARDIADQIYMPKAKSNSLKEKKISQQKSHTVHYGYIHDNGVIIDEAVIIIMCAPNSYTREALIEITCHGGRYVTQKILELVIKKGARAAEPGEFTKRAFLNGRIDLSQAEAVTEIIHAKNKYALQNSIAALRGNIKTEIEKIRNEILFDIAFIEASLDDPENIEIDGFTVKLRKKTAKHLQKLNHILMNYENGRIIKEGIKTVILGKPNVGKSSLLNLFLRQERAIVTNDPGTTRDILEEEVQ
ncbi:MAG: 50S ribosome-binding GTPase, partial [Lachnoclostridium sp.]|nr:50S ribosome-binding GTPase [Lachnoclostridium sp.]